MTGRRASRLKIAVRKTDNYTGLVTVDFDIGCGKSRMRTRELPGESEALLRAITDSVGDAVVMMDPRGKITFWNPAAESILGYSSGEAMGVDLHALLAPERYPGAYREAFPRFLRTSCGNTAGKKVDLPARRKDGREISIELCLSTIELNGERHAVGIVRDVTERVERGRALHDSEEKFRQLAENICEVFWMLSPAADECFYVSPAYEQIWGRTCESIYRDPLSWQQSIHPEDVEPARAVFARQIQGELVPSEYRILTPGGEVKWIRDRAFPVRDQTGEMIRVIGIAQEITDQKHYEQELIHAREAAEAANRAKSVFLATMSHELRTPLNAILGFTELLDVEMEDNGVEEWRADLQKIRTAGNHLLELISEVMDLSKIEAGRMELVPTSFEMAPLVAEVAAGVEPLAAKNRVKVNLACDPALVYGDRLRIRQCVFNLVGNACKFTHDGQVTVTGSVESGSDGDWYTVRVADTGIGISPEDMGKLFSDFTQLDALTNRKYGGSGLGLAISRRLSRLMGGDITAESRLGQGSVFAFRFPARLSCAKVL